MPCPSVIVKGSPIAIVGEAPGKEEIEGGRPFVGASGQELAKMLSQAGVNINDCSLLNVFEERPAGNKIEHFCGSKKDCGKDYHFPPLRAGKYFLPKHISGNLSRLKVELEAIRPNVVLALGNTACWALLGYSGISNIRGTATSSSLLEGLKVLPTYHPAAILRAWELRPIAIADLIKAEKESHFSQIIRPEREVWIDPTIGDINEFITRYLLSTKECSIDIETGHSQIKCVGVASDPYHAIVIPFVDIRKRDYNYWPDLESEREAWSCVRRIMELPCAKVFQNGVYDIQWLWRKAGLRFNGEFEDTMLMHHALQPEMEKSLGFLGSIYTNEASWKLMRTKAARTETTKRDE